MIVLVIVLSILKYFQSKILYNIAIVGKYEEIPDKFFKTIEKFEPCPHVFVQWSSAIVRTCQHKIIISECIRAMQIAVDLEPSINNKIELAYQTYLAGQYEKAIQLYDDITSEIEPVPKAIEGIILCWIAMNKISVQVSVSNFSYYYSLLN